MNNNTSFRTKCCYSYCPLILVIVYELYNLQMKFIADREIQVVRIFINKIVWSGNTYILFMVFTLPFYRRLDACW